MLLSDLTGIREVKGRSDHVEGLADCKVFGNE